MPGKRHSSHSKKGSFSFFSLTTAALDQSASSQKSNANPPSASAALPTLKTTTVQADTALKIGVHKSSTANSSSAPTQLVKNTVASPKKASQRSLIQDPGKQIKRIDYQKIDPIIFDSLAHIKSILYPLIPAELFNQISIVPVLVGSFATLYHPDANGFNSIMPNDIDWEFLCLVHNPSTTAFEELNHLLSTHLSLNFLANSSTDPLIKIRAIHTHFDYSPLCINVKFTVFTHYTIDHMLEQSAVDRKIYPKANLIEFVWDFETNKSAYLHYYPLWLDFTVDLDNPCMHEVKHEMIAYALIFHHINPLYPMTNQFLNKIHSILQEIQTNPFLLTHIQEAFLKLFYKKALLTHIARDELRENAIQVFDYILNHLQSALNLCVITLNSRIEPPPITTHPFFCYYTKLDSFCDAVIRQMIRLKYTRLEELGLNSIVQLKKSLNVVNRNTPLLQILSCFHEKYPDIRVLVFKQNAIDLTLESSVIYSQQLGFRRGGNKRVEGVYTEYMTDDERISNKAENSSAQSINPPKNTDEPIKNDDRPITIELVQCADQYIPLLPHPHALSVLETPELPPPTTKDRERNNFLF